MGFQPEQHDVQRNAKEGPRRAHPTQPGKAPCSACTFAVDCPGTAALVVTTSTTAAITGAICGAQLGGVSIPEEWLRGFRDYPRSLRWISQLGERLGRMRTSGVISGPLPLAVYLLPLRNLFFLCVVLLHGLRRIFPPW